MNRVRIASGLASLLAAAVCASPVAAAPTPPLAHSGPWITDAKGRVVITHGVNVVNKRPPYSAAAEGFDSDDARFLADNGFTSVRLGFAWSAVEPEPGRYDDAYVQQLAATQRMLARHGIYTVLDSHQDLFNKQVSSAAWDGFPGWAVFDNGLPVEPDGGVPTTYFTGPAENQAWTSLWNNHAAADGVGLQDHYAAMFARVARSVGNSKFLLGYDLINEPWPGTAFATCAPPAGCPAFEQGPLAALQAKVMKAIRAADNAHLLFYEPALTAQGGAKVFVPNPTRDARAGMSFHVYCALAFAVAGLSCPDGEALILNNGLARANANGGPGLVTEFGGTDDTALLERMTDLLDEHLASWQFWAYDEHLVPDMHRAPSGDNVLGANLSRLSRPYPQLVAGTPEAFGYDRGANSFSLRYTTDRSGGGRFPAGSVSEVFVPRLHYPDGYAVDVEGARVASSARSSVLRLAALSGAREVRVTVHPGSGTFPRVRPGLRVRVAPKRDRHRPFRLRVSGRVRPLAGTPRDAACTGALRLRARVRRGARSTRRARLGTNCRFSARVRVRGRGRVRVHVRFAGNTVLLPAARVSRARAG